MISYARVIDARFFSKSISVLELETILQALKSTDRLEPNAVGNLAVIRDGTYSGYIDLGKEVLRIPEEDNDDLDSRSNKTI